MSVATVRSSESYRETSLSIETTNPYLSPSSILPFDFSPSTLTLPFLDLSQLPGATISTVFKPRKSSSSSYSSFYPAAARTVVRPRSKSNKRHYSPPPLGSKSSSSLSRDRFPHSSSLSPLPAAFRSPPPEPTAGLDILTISNWIARVAIEEKNIEENYQLIEAIMNEFPTQSHTFVSFPPKEDKVISNKRITPPMHSSTAATPFLTFSSPYTATTSGPIQFPIVDDQIPTPPAVQSLSQATESNISSIALPPLVIPRLTKQHLPSDSYIASTATIVDYFAAPPPPTLNVNQSLPVIVSVIPPSPTTITPASTLTSKKSPQFIASPLTTIPTVISSAQSTLASSLDFIDSDYFSVDKTEITVDVVDNTSDSKSNGSVLDNPLSDSWDCQLSEEEDEGEIIDLDMKMMGTKAKQKKEEKRREEEKNKIETVVVVEEWDLLPGEGEKEKAKERSGAEGEDEYEII